MEVDENLVNQTTPNFNSSSIEPSLPLGQFSPSKETVKYQPISIQGEKKKSLWKKIIIYFFSFIGSERICYSGKSKWCRRLAAYSGHKDTECK